MAIKGNDFETTSLVRFIDEDMAGSRLGQQPSQLNENSASECLFIKSLTVFTLQGAWPVVPDACVPSDASGYYSVDRTDIPATVEIYYLA